MAFGITSQDACFALDTVLTGSVCLTPGISEGDFEAAPWIGGLTRLTDDWDGGAERGDPARSEGVEITEDDDLGNEMAWDLGGEGGDVTLDPVKELGARSRPTRTVAARDVEPLSLTMP